MDWGSKGKSFIPYSRMGLNFLELGWEVYALEFVLLKKNISWGFGNEEFELKLCYKYPSEIYPVVRKLHRLRTWGL